MFSVLRSIPQFILYASPYIVVDGREEIMSDLRVREREGSMHTLQCLFTELNIASRIEDFSFHGTPADCISAVVLNWIWNFSEGHLSEQIDPDHES